jgi:RimJ/RimL family protein N-acetyltransferase
VSLRPVSREDYPLFFAWRSTFDSIHSLNWRRRIATFEEFVREFEAMLPQSIVMLVTAKGRPVGYGLGYNINPWDRWMAIGGYVDAHGAGASVRGGEASLLFIDLLFRLYPVDKLIAEVYEFAETLRQMFHTMGFEEAGFIPEHYWHEDRRWGLYHMVLTRERWYDYRELFGDTIAVQHMATNEPSTGVGIVGQRGDM